MSGRSMIFKDLLFSIAGNLGYRSSQDVVELVQNHGGRFSYDVTPKVNIVLTSESIMAPVWTNPYKLQFVPDFQKQVELAQVYSIPIVDGSFLDECIEQNKLVDKNQFIIKAFLVDVESKFKVKKEVESSLDPRVQEIVTMLFDQKEIDRSLVDLGVDVRKISLITQENIKSAYGILKSLEGQLQPSPTQTKQQHEAELTRVSNLFYNIIPHRGSTPPIKTIETIKEKSSLLEALTDIEIANRLLKEKGGEGDLNMNPIDINYRKLRAEIVPVEKYRAEYQMIEQMVQNTQSDQFKYNIELEEVFELNREGEADRFAPYVKLPHHRLLWHGSRMSNYIGIISQGLRIAPPEAPVTGYFLGKGIYFADMVSVSGQYCHTSNEHQIGFMLLCDVALGRTFQLAHGKFIGKDDLDGAGFHSVKCWGTKGPDPGYDTQTPDGLIVSLGRENTTGVPVSELIHSEIVVYDNAQVKMKYLLKVKFQHTK
eukprot:TRINITY_DN1648_c0_g2_i1.p1 TRINITY_DN1648_c0_g2~~TRINITY_DN1648_c0_g2_i1.p1  ORF type:complete len:483 (-),score=84.40 TRINITY_DN1648_c0_g2_i1:141-1589(-)